MAESRKVQTPHPFYNRTKVRLTTLGLVRSEMARAYRAAVRKELDWQDLRAAIAALSAMAQIDMGYGLEQRLQAVEARMSRGRSITPNNEYRTVGRSLPDRPVVWPDRPQPQPADEASWP